jgi:hypothetical protein
MRISFINKRTKAGLYSVFQGFRKAKSANGGSILSSGQFLILPQLPQKIKLASKVVKVDSKIIISYLRSKSLKLTVEVAVCKGVYPTKHLFI